VLALLDNRQPQWRVLPRLGPSVIQGILTFENNVVIGYL
jgi:hypothetical protein